MAKIATESWSNLTQLASNPCAVPDGFPQIELVADNHSMTDRLIAQMPWQPHFTSEIDAALPPFNNGKKDTILNTPRPHKLIPLGE